MDLYEFSAVMAFRRGDRAELSKWLKERTPSKPLSKDLYQIFLELVEGKTGRPRGRPAAGNILDMMDIAYRVGFQVRKGLLVKEAVDKVARERRCTFSYVKKAHQKYRWHAELFLGS